MPINWLECCICQSRTKEPLCSTAKECESLAKYLLLFAELNEFSVLYFKTRYSTPYAARELSSKSYSLSPFLQNNI